MKIKTLVFFIFLLSLCLNKVSAQHHSIISACGTELTPTMEYERKKLVKERSIFTQQFIRGEHFPQARNSNDLVPIQVHVIQRNDGTGGLDLNILNNALAQLNTYYANANIEFFQCAAVNYINNDTYYNFERADSDDDLVSFLTDGAINLFFTGTVHSFGLHVGGYASIPNQYQRFVVAESGALAGTTLLEHEMGHIFGLAHTHGQWGHSLSDCPTNPTTHPSQVWCQGAVRYYNSNTDDNNDGINDCEQTGDEVCDTPADPNLNGNVTGCTYTGTVTDYFGDSFSPLMDNIMSYGPNNCINSFTPGQYARIRFWYDNYLQYTLCHNCNGMGNTIRVVTNTNDTGTGSLRAAIDCANATMEQTSIHFDISGTGDKTIQLQSTLPPLYNGTIIDGTTQPDGKIILECNQYTETDYGAIDIQEAGSEIYGLTIQNSTVQGIIVRANDVKIGAVNKGNTIKNSGRTTSFGFGIILYDDASNVEIIGNTIENNNRIGTYVFGNSTNVLISQNSFYCNQFGIFMGDNANGMPATPWINAADDLGIVGGSVANAIVEVFVGQTCSGGQCEGAIYLGTTTADGLGNWHLSFPLQNAIYNGDNVIATARLGDKSSTFSTCFNYTGSDYSPSPPPCASYFGPENAVDSVGSKIVFFWEEVTQATGYKIYVGTDGGGTQTPTDFLNGTVVNAGGPPFYELSNLQPNTTYYWQAVAFNNNGDAVDCPIWSFQTALSPANDLCGDAIELTPSTSCNYQLFSNLSSTNSGQAPSPQCKIMENDVWFKVIMPASGNLTIETGMDSTSTLGLFDVDMEVYSGDCSGGLTSIACGGDIDPNPPFPDFPNLHVQLDISNAALANQMVYIRVWGAYGGQGTFNLCAHDPSVSTNTCNPCDTFNFPTVPFFGDTTFIACDSIISGMDIINTPMGNSDVTYQSGISITLKPGFHVRAGADFLAQIAPCNSVLVEQSAYSRELINQNNPINTITQIDVFPNPFSSGTTIQFAVSEAMPIQLQLIDITGKVVQTIVPLSHYETGQYQINLQNEQLQTGIYFFQLASAKERLVKKVMVIR